MLDHIVLFVQSHESLQCARCAGTIMDDNAYLIEYVENGPVTAFVRCEHCFEQMVERNETC